MGCCSGPKYLNNQTLKGLMMECITCDGWGDLIQGDGITPCPQCKGTGNLNEDNGESSSEARKEIGKSESTIYSKQQR